jgi:hypothetical protein
MAAPARTFIKPDRGAPSTILQPTKRHNTSKKGTGRSSFSGRVPLALPPLSPNTVTPPLPHVEMKGDIRKFFSAPRGGAPPAVAAAAPATPPAVQLVKTGRKGSDGVIALPFGEERGEHAIREIILGRKSNGDADVNQGHTFKALLGVPASEKNISRKQVGERPSCKRQLWSWST